MTADDWTPWDYKAESGVTAGSTDLVGYEVEANDGHIGKVDEATYVAGSSYVVVDTGPWIFGKKVVLPAAVVDKVDHNHRKVHVNRTKSEIRHAPEFDFTNYLDTAHRDDLARYYGHIGARLREEPPA
jgi:hypothetical protein